MIYKIIIISDLNATLKFVYYPIAESYIYATKVYILCIKNEFIC